MNHHNMPAGPGQNPHQPPHPQYPHPQQRRDYHAYNYPMQPQSPHHHHPYGPYGQPNPYYAHPGAPPPQYAPRHWQQPYPPYMMQPPPPPQPQQMPYPQRSPMVVSSQPYQHPPPPQTMTPVRQTPVPPPQMMHPVSQSPRPIPQHVPPHVQTPVAPPSPAPMQKQESFHEQEKVLITPQPVTTPPPPEPSASTRRQSVAPLSLPPEYKMPFYPDLPWYSPNAAEAFPRRAARRRRRRQNLDDIDGVALPARDGAEEEEQADGQTSEVSTIAAPSEPETPATSQAPSESDYTQTSVPATPAQDAVVSPKATPKQTPAHARRDTRTAIAVPNIPALSKPKPATPETGKAATPQSEKSAVTDEQKSLASEVKSETDSTAGEEATSKSPPPAPKPVSWAGLFSKPKTFSAGPNLGTVVNGAPIPKNAPLAEVLRQYNPDNDIAVHFTEPKGIVNGGNMCYMTSVLQVMLHISRMYSHLEQVALRSVHSMKSNTPLLDAMVMFQREFKVIKEANSVEALRSQLTQQELEQYGDAVTPQYVYDAIAKVDRFNSMRRGHQQDAEEFLGFLLEQLHDEEVSLMRGQPDSQPEENGVTSPSSVKSPTSTDGGWLEVGPKQRASTTRTAGHQSDLPSPITKIFGGFLRSVLRVPGLKDSVTLEPFKPLQLDISAPHISNIYDALRNLTHTETLSGDFGGKGGTNTAKKQVFIEKLPPVLILHLKRFEYNLTGTQKIWKKVGYPLELEIPKEVFPPGVRGGLEVKGGLPKYRLISVVYHHGKSAAGGHYTVDVLREDYREWVRMDDTVIRRIRPEDVAEGGREEDPKVLAKRLEQAKAEEELKQQRQGNMYEGLDEEREEEERPWNEVNGHVYGHRKWSSVANAASATAAAEVKTNGTATPVSQGKKTPKARDGVAKDRVAYILMYERIRT